MALAPPGWLGERLLLCGPGRDARLFASDGSAVALLPDAQGCSAVWPRQAGNYHWQDHERRGIVPVRAPADAPALHANGARAATLALPGAAAPVRHTEVPGQPGPHWPGWFAFVLLAALTWWLERRRDDWTKAQKD